MRKTILLFLLLSAAALTAQQDSALVKEPGLIMRFTLYDSPFMDYAARTVHGPGGELTFSDYLRGYADPGMDKATAVSNSVYSAIHYAFRNTLKTKFKFLNKYVANACSGLADLVLFYAPLGNGWLHEEYHRSVMTLYHTNSFNDMNTFPIGKEVVSVHDVKDTDLAMMKSSYNPDFVRMMEAGIEGQYNQIRLLQKDNFFHRQDLQHSVLYIATTINSIYYVISTSYPTSDKLTNTMMSEEGTNIAKRDFTGLDFDAWVYDLYHSDEPYSSRGIHPSGVGYKRYIRPSDLSYDELHYLRRQGYLQLINLLSPAMATFGSIKLKTTARGTYYGNIAFRHMLTSFGNDISSDVFLKTPKRNWFFSAHLYKNRYTFFGGLEAELIDEPVKMRRNNILISSRLMAWTQPSGQSFFSNVQQPGALAALTIDFPLTKNVYFSFTAKAKTEGWVMGETYVKQNTSFLVGVRTHFFRK